MGEYQNIINERVTDYLISCYRPYNGELAAFRKRAEEDRVPVILPDAETLILNIIRIMKPERILEIGTAVGYSSCCFAEVSGVPVDTVEKKESVAVTARDNIRDMGLQNLITVYTGDGEEVVCGLDHTYDFIFIDAAKSHYRRFFDAAVSKAKDGAVIVCDNVLFKARVVSDEYDPSGKYKTNIRRMREFIDYLLSLDYADTSLIPAGDGLTVTVLKHRG
ncbi:MAG: O-methyltransferase [Clostridiales bacterium]|nr:O-methyltransferase [Clostridiales bacterium]